MKCMNDNNNDSNNHNMKMEVTYVPPHHHYHHHQYHQPQPSDSATLAVPTTFCYGSGENSYTAFLSPLSAMPLKSDGSLSVMEPLTLTGSQTQGS